MIFRFLHHFDSQAGILKTSLALVLLTISATCVGAAPNHGPVKFTPGRKQIEKADPVEALVTTLPSNLTLEQAFRIARINSPELKNARSEVRQFLNNIKELKTGYLPKLTIDVRAPEWIKETDESTILDNSDYTDTRGTIGVTQFLPTNTEISLSASRALTAYDRRLEGLELSISQELLHKNTLTRDLSVSKRRAELSLFSERSILRNFVHQVRTAYFTQLERSQISNRNKQRAKEEKELQEANELQYESGIIAEYDVLDYRADYNRFLRTQLNDEAATRQARNNLFFVLKVDPPSTPVTFADVDPQPYIDIQWDVQEMLQVAMQEDADVASLRFAIFQSETNLDYFWNDYMPSVQLYASAIRRRDEFVFTDRALDSEEYRMGLRLSWSLIGEQAGAYYRELSERQELEINQTNLEERFAFYKNKIANDLVELERLRQNYKLNQDNVAISDREYELSLLRFETGTIGSWDMIRTKNRYFGAQDSLISAKYDFLLHVSAMLRDYPVNPLSTQL